LQPVERGCRVGKLSRTVVEQALAPSHTSEVEAKHGKAPLLEGVVQVINHLVIHGPAELRVRVQDERHRCVRSALMVVAGLDPAGRAADIHFRHETLASTPTLRHLEKFGGLGDKRANCRRKP
jgi:hypothetical protein